MSAPGATSATSMIAARPVRRVLVTGGAGFLGHHLVTGLLDEGFQVTVLDDLSTGSLDNLPTHPDLTFLQGTVLTPQDIARAAEGCDFVFHLAGVVGMRLAVGDRDKAYRVAVEGTKVLLEQTGDLPAVLFSSSAVYGLTGARPVSEEDKVGEAECLAYDGGHQGYAAGKWGLEKVAHPYIDRGRSICIIRPFNVVGEGQTGRYGMVVPSFIKMARAGEPITVYDDGEQTRSFGEVRTAVGAILKLIRRPEAFHAPHNVFNLGTTSCTRIIDLATIVKEETGSTSEIAYIPYVDIFGKEDVRARVPDPRRLEQLIGPIQWPTIREIVRGLVQGSRSEVATADRV